MIAVKKSRIAPCFGPVTPLPPPENKQFSALNYCALKGKI